MPIPRLFCVAGRPSACGSGGGGGGGGGGSLPAAPVTPGGSGSASILEPDCSPAESFANGSPLAPVGTAAAPAVDLTHNEQTAYVGMILISMDLHAHSYMINVRTCD